MVESKKGIKEPIILQASFQLTDHDLEVLDLMMEILSFFEIATRRLEGDGVCRRRRKTGIIRSFGNIWDVPPIY